MRASLAFLLALAIAPVLAQPLAPANRKDEKGRRTGPWSATWPNGRLRYEGTFKEDKPLGEFKHYDEDGRLSSIVVHAGDGRTSRARHFHPGGTLMAQGKYLGQAKDSTWNYYDADGKLRKVERYAKGLLEGEQMTYYPDGQPAESETRRAGVLHGPLKGWFANGKLKNEAEYVNGEPEGRMTFYYPDGKKEIEGHMVNGQREGTWFHWNSDGSLQLQVLYQRGRMLKEKRENGTFTDHFDDERPKREETWRKGLREGRCIEWHDNGRWVVKPRPADPVMGIPADHERVLEGQTKKMECTYKAGELHGEMREWDERGKLLRTTVYDNGRAVSVNGRPVP